MPTRTEVLKINFQKYSEREWDWSAIFYEDYFDDDE